MLIILAIFAWAVFFLPNLLRARAERTAGGLFGDLRDRLGGARRAGSFVGSTGSLSLARSARARRSRKRRRDIFMGLLAAIIGTLVLGFFPGFQVLWALNVVLDVLFAGYLALLVRVRGSISVNRALQRRDVASTRREPASSRRRMLRPVEEQAEPSLAFAYAKRRSS